MNIKIGEAKKKDINTIVALNSELAECHKKIDNYYAGKESSKSYKKWLLKNFDNKNLKIFVAKNNGKIIGYFTGKIRRTKPHIIPRRIGYLEGAYISNSYRNKSVGRMLFKRFLSWVNEKRINDMEVSVDSRNKNGLNAWKKYGFVEYQKKMKMKI